MTAAEGFAGWRDGGLAWIDGSVGCSVGLVLAWSLVVGFFMGWLAGSLVMGSLVFCFKAARQDYRRPDQSTRTTLMTDDE